MTDELPLLDKLEAAREAIAAAERDLEQLLKDLAVSPRAEKTTVSAVVEAAFTKLRTAKLVLSSLESDVHELE